MLAELAFVKVCKSRKTAAKLEAKLKAKFRGLGLWVDGFKTESLPKELCDSFVDIVKSFDFNQGLRDTVDISKTTDWRRMQQLNLTSTDLANKQTEAAFGYTFADPMERFKLFKQLVEMRMLLAKHGIKDKKDLDGLLGVSEGSTD